MDPRRRSNPPEFPPTPVGFKIWFAVCGLVGLSLLAVGVWAVVKLVNHFAG